MTFARVEGRRTASPVAVLSRGPGVSRSEDSARRARDPSDAARRRGDPAASTRAAHAETRLITSGSPRPPALAPGVHAPRTSSSGRTTRTAAHSPSTSRGEDQITGPAVQRRGDTTQNTWVPETHSMRFKRTLHPACLDRRLVGIGRGRGKRPATVGGFVGSNPTFPAAFSRTVNAVAMSRKTNSGLPAKW